MSPTYFFTLRHKETGDVTWCAKHKNEISQTIRDTWHIVKIYVLNEDSTITEYEEPERLYACKTDEGAWIDQGWAHGANWWTWERANATFYELMPNGDYRKMSDDEVIAMPEAIYTGRV